MKKVVIKIVIMTVIWSAYSLAFNIFYPVINNDIAMTQLESTTESFTNYAMFQNLWSFTVIIPIILTVTVFWKEIKIIINKIKEELGK